MNEPIIDQLAELVNEDPNAPAPMDPTPPAARARLLRPSTMRCCRCRVHLDAGDSVVRLVDRWFCLNCA